MQEINEQFVEYSGLGRQFVTIAIFPLTLVAILGGAIYALSVGFEASIILVVGTLVGTAIVAIAERLHPHTHKWNENHGDVNTDFLHLFLITIVSTGIVEMIVKVVFGLIAIQVAVLVPSMHWPNNLPLVVQLIGALVIAEFGYYWYHRAAHEKLFFWRLHATHHSPHRLYWLNANRFHPLDNWIAYSLEFGPLVMLGAPQEVIALFALFTAVHGIFQHANIRLKLGPLNYIFSMAELHRWHHSRNIEHANHNYGANLIIWDIVFGTRFAPSDMQQANDDIGIEMEKFPTTFWAQMVSPFRWKELESNND